MSIFKTSVLVKNPRKNPAFGLLSLGILSILFIIIAKYLSYDDLITLCGKNDYEKIGVYTVKILGGVFLLSSFISFFISVVRNNTKSQPIEIFIFVFGFVLSFFFTFFSTPILLLWAHVHGYHVDHYEAAHRGGWYIFKRDGT